MFTTVTATKTKKDKMSDQMLVRENEIKDADNVLVRLPQKFVQAQVKKRKKKLLIKYDENQVIITGKK